MTRSLTLRDLRRLAPRRVGTSPRWLYLRRGSLEVPSWTTSEIDAAIARHGSRALLSDLLEAAARSTPQGAVGESPTVDETDAHCSTPPLDDTRDKLSPPSDPEGPIEASTDARSYEANSLPGALAPGREPSKTQEIHDHAYDEASAAPAGSAAEDGDEPRPAEGRAGAPGESSAAGAHEESSAHAREATPRPPEQLSAGPHPACPSGSGCAPAYGDEDASPSGESGAGSSPTAGGPSTANCTEGRPVTEVRAASPGGPDSASEDPSDDVEAAERGTSGRDDAPDSESATRRPPTALSSRRLPRRAFGGCYADPLGPAWRPARELRGDTRALARELLRLFPASEVGGDRPSPRVDARRLVVELVTRRYAISRAARRELAPPVVVLACDVSGSCSAVCADTLAACAATALDLAHAVVVRHSNGHVIDVEGEPARALPDRADDGGDVMLAQLPRLLSRRVACTVAFGDWDAGEDYRQLCEGGGALYWLDSYAARSGGPRSASGRHRAGAVGWRAQPAGWWQGVNDARRAAQALSTVRRST